MAIRIPKKRANEDREAEEEAEILDRDGKERMRAMDDEDAPYRHRNFNDDFDNKRQKVDDENE